LVVSCLSLFAHLPTYVLPIGSLLGAQATMMLFGVRFAAIVVEIIVLLLVSNFLIRPGAEKAAAHGAGTAVPDIATPASNPSKQKKFWPQVWSRSRRTLRRLMIYLIPTFAVMVSLEYFGFFGWLKVQVPGLFTFSFLPAQSVAIIPAQAASLYNGAVVAANFVKEGAISTHQAVLIILIGSLVTAPVRTLKHALPTYVAILGPKRGLVLAVSAQVLRSIFLILFVVVLWRVWR
jgi:hypothetical protein